MGAGRERPCPLTGHTLPRAPAQVSGWPDLDPRDRAANEVAGPAFTRGGQLGVHVAVFILGKRLCARNPAPSRRPLRPAAGPPEPGPSPRSLCLCVRRALVFVDPPHPPGTGPEPRRTHFLLDGALGLAVTFAPLRELEDEDRTRRCGRRATALGLGCPGVLGLQFRWAWDGPESAPGVDGAPRAGLEGRPVGRGRFSAGAAGHPPGADRLGTGPSPAGGAAGLSFAMSPRPTVVQPRVQCVGPGKCVCRLLAKRGTG